MCIKDYFLIGPRIIFCSITNIFFGLQCIAGLAFENESVPYPEVQEEAPASNPDGQALEAEPDGLEVEGPLLSAS